MNRAKEIKNEVTIITDEKLLRDKSVPTSVDECEDIRLWEKLEKGLSNVDGYGLAAVQIGYPIRASIIDYDGKKIQLVNPEILEFSGTQHKLRGEGCLSFPDQYVNTLRDIKIKVKDDINGETEYEGWEAFIIQHEIDHMDGILIFDRQLKPYKRENPKIGRNDPCRCGSGKKYKKCCGK